MDITHEILLEAGFILGENKNSDQEYFRYCTLGQFSVFLCPTRHYVYLRIFELDTQYQHDLGIADSMEGVKRSMSAYLGIKTVDELYAKREKLHRLSDSVRK